MAALSAGSAAALMEKTMSEWKDGFPKREGFYRCLIEGELEMKLKFYICQVSRKPHWIDNQGNYVIDRVQWTGDPIR